MTAPIQPVLEALLDAWDRNNLILLNLLATLPPGALDIKPRDDSPSIAQLFAHIHYVRLVFVSEDVPEFAVKLPDEEWQCERHPDRIAQMLKESAKLVREGVSSRVVAAQDTKVHYDHPILLLQHMIWHEGVSSRSDQTHPKARGRSSLE